MTDEPILPKGHKFEGPDGQGYETTRAIYRWEHVSADQFRPYGGAPEPISGMTLPDWLNSQIFGHQEIVSTRSPNT